MKKLIGLALMIIGVCLTPHSSHAQLFVGPLPPLIGPKDQAQVDAVTNLLLGNPGTYSPEVLQWANWMLSGNPFAAAPAQNIIPLDLANTLHKYYATDQPLSDAEWIMVNNFEHNVTYLANPVYEMLGDYGTGIIIDYDNMEALAEAAAGPDETQVMIKTISTYQALGNQVEY